jgi:hypothetical protein
MEESSLGLFKARPLYLPKVTEENHEKPSKIAGLRVEI